jgi:hypothetical protein
LSLEARQRRLLGSGIDGAGADPSKLISAAAECLYETATDVVTWRPDKARSS